MSDDPWGADTPSALAGAAPPLPPELAALGAFVAGEAPCTWPAGRDLPTELDLPEVQALANEGWYPVERGSPGQLLPAVWPREHRCWVPDRLPRVMLAMTEERSWIEPLSAWAREQQEVSLTEEAAAAGLPIPPAGRLWLLRSPWPSLSTELVFAVLWQWCDEHVLWMQPDGMVVAAREVLGWAEERVWDWWTGPQAEAAKAWRAAGRPVLETSQLALAGLPPEETARLTRPIEMGGAGLSEAQAAVWCDAVMRDTLGDTVAAIIGWRSLGLPTQPRQSLWMTLHEMEPSEGRGWLADGFTIEDVSALSGLVARDVARRWRDIGYAAGRARALLLADRSLRPEEAAAFDAAALDPEAVIGWVETGFSAAEARAWTDLDILPHEARVWRWGGLGPEDARRQRAVGSADPLPAGIEIGWAGFGEGREDRRYSVTDPPGTRGAVAATDRELQ